MRSESTIGFQSATLSFVLWGLLPIYWKLMKIVPSEEVLSHRIIWSVLFVYLILFFQRRTSELVEALRDKRTVKLMTGSGLLIGANWFIYIWAVNHDMVLETSLGYYICPMISVLLGFFLSEREDTRTDDTCTYTGIYGYHNNDCQLREVSFCRRFFWL